MADYFIADTHFGHEAVLRYSRRPFATVEEMDEEIARRWNMFVKPGDRVFHLGDVSLCRDLARVDALLGRLAGQKFWVLGNHDHTDERKKYAHRFQKVERMMDVRIGKGADARDLVLCHFPLLTWNKCHHGAWMLHGHSHGGLAYPRPGRIVDVGVDAWSYAPVSFDELRDRLDPLPVTPHHDMPRERTPLVPAASREPNAVQPQPSPPVATEPGEEGFLKSASDSSSSPAAALSLEGR